MSTPDKDIRQLHADVEHVLNDAGHMLADLKGRKHFKGVVKKDVRHLREHLDRLIEHVDHLEREHVR